jgi:hypothetical protein
MKQQFHKILFFIPLTVFTAFCFFGLTANAQTTDAGYHLLAPFPFPILEKTTDITLVDYMKGVFVATIGLAIVLAVVELVIGGIEYAAAVVPSSKEDAKRRIGGAVGGLLLILMAWVILQALNPKLLGVGLNLEKVGMSSGTGSATGGGLGTSPPPGAGGGPMSDKVNRDRLLDAGIDIKSGVSLEGVRAETIDEVIALKTACSFCPITATAGVDGHAAGTLHALGYKLDMRMDTTLSTYIESHYGPPVGTRSDGAILYKAPDGAIYAKEIKATAPHWDLLVCPVYNANHTRCA